MTTVNSFPFRIGDLRDRADAAKTVLTKTYTGRQDSGGGYDWTFSTPDGFDDVVSQRCGAG
jgi:hypothetical protein